MMMSLYSLMAGGWGPCRARRRPVQSSQKRKAVDCNDDLTGGRADGGSVRHKGMLISKHGCGRGGMHAHAIDSVGCVDGGVGVAGWMHQARA